MKYASDTCPVCGMAANTELPSVQHQKMYFYFCSAQCKATFLTHPPLYIKAQGAKRKELIKQRTVHFTVPLTSEVIVLLEPYLKKMMGVKKISFDESKMHITYDLLQITEMQIEKALVEVGIQLGGGWIKRLCRGWTKDSEEIELKNLAAPSAPCCNRSPPRT